MKPLLGAGRFLAAALCLACAPRTCAAAERPNILVLISDDQSWLHTGANGSTVVKTPNFDRAVGGVLAALDKSGKASNTLVVVTSDNGMPFPRCKTTLYDGGVRMPLAVRWPARVKGGRVVDDFISLADLAPTFLRAAGLDPLPEMTGRSFLDVLLSEASGRVDPARDRATFGRERHGKSWPCRALRDDRFLYIRNFAPERIDGLLIDDSPSSKFVIAHAEDPSHRRCYELAFGPRPAEELYDVRGDPEQVRNLAAQPDRAAVLKEMREALEAELRRADDPRILGLGKEFDDYPGPTME